MVASISLSVRLRQEGQEKQVNLVFSIMNNQLCILIFGREIQELIFFAWINLLITQSKQCVDLVKIQWPLFTIITISNNIISSSTHLSIKQRRPIPKIIVILLTHPINKVNNSKYYPQPIMKGVASINPIFQPFNSISSPQVFSIDPFIVADTRHHSVYFRSENISLKIEPKIIINTCYSKKYGVVMLLTEDGRLRIYTENLQQIARIPWQSKYSVGFDFLTNDRMLMIGANQIQLLYVKVHSNIKSTKFVSSMTFNFEKKEKYIVEPETKLQWNKGFNFNPQKQFLYLWSSKDINFYSLKKLNLIAHIPSLTRKELAITYVYYNVNYKYTITGLVNGHIRVWRLPVNIKEYANTSNPHNYTGKDYILLHNYIGHSKAVQKIIEVNFSNNSKEVNSILISSSLELSVCFWSLETFELLRFYDFQGQYTSIFLHNSLYSLAIKEKKLGMLQWGKNLEFITDVTSEIISFDKHRSQFTFNKSQRVESVQLTLGSNIGFQIRDSQLDAKDLNKIEIQYIYPPLKAKGIQQIICSPYDENQYYLLVENGEIFKLRIEENSGKIEQSYQIEKAKDTESHQLNQLASIIAFLPIIPPCFDSQINENVTEKKTLSEQSILQVQNKELYKQKYLDQKLIAVGCSKGAVVFFKLSNFQNIYTRVTYHRQPITKMESFTCQDVEYIASCCLQNYLKIIKFDKINEKAQCIISIHTGTNLTKIMGFQDRIGVVFKKGFFEVYQVSPIPNNKSGTKKGLQNSEYQLVCYKNTNGNDHQLEIYSIDCDTKNKLILTAGADNKIKVWTYYKALVYEIYLDEGLKCAIWFRNMEMLVSHNLKILYFRNIGLKVKVSQIEQANEEITDLMMVENFFETLKFIEGIEEQNHSDRQLTGLQQSKFKIEIFDNKRSPKTKQKISPNNSPLRKSGRHSLAKGPNQIQLQLQTGRNDRFSESKDQRTRKIRDLASHIKSETKKKKKVAKSQTVIDEPEQRHSKISDSDLQVMRKHLNEMKNLKKEANESILPKIGPKNEDIFDNFMRSKLLNKKVLTRRDITLNRIIMKNIIKDHFGNDSDVVNNLKLDF